MPGDPDKDIDPEDYSDEVFDVHKAVRQVPYEEQFDHYFKVDEESGPTPPSAENSSDSGGSLDEEW